MIPCTYSGNNTSDGDKIMLLCTTWKTRPLSPEQTHRMMATWGKLEAEGDADPNTERLCWFMFGDGSGGFTVSRVADEAAEASGLESALALGEFLEMETRPVMDLESAMPAIVAAVARIGG